MHTDIYWWPAYLELLRDCRVHDPLPNHTWVVWVDFRTKRITKIIAGRRR